MYENIKTIGIINYITYYVTPSNILINQWFKKVVLI